MDELIDLNVERTFHGVVYYISVNATADSLCIEVEQKSTGDSWTATFQAQYIEEITSKTGNFKKYSTFLKMLQSAINNQTESVYIDILTYQDLEQIKNKRKQAQTQQITQTNKRYLILSYIVEFDKVHYPLPLQFNEHPDIQNLKNIIIKLRIENESLNQIVTQFKKEINPTDLLQEQMKEIEYLKGLTDQKDKEIIELKNMIHQLQNSTVKKTEHLELRTRYLNLEQNTSEFNKRINDLEESLSQVIDENQLLKQIDKKNKQRITTLEQELQSTLSKRKPLTSNVSRSPSLKKSNIKVPSKKTTPVRQRKPSIDSESESSFRKKNPYKRLDSPSARSTSSLQNNSSKKKLKTPVQKSQKSFKKTIPKNSNEDPEEQKLLQRLKDLRERNKENAMSLTIPSSRLDQSSVEDLTSIDERLGKLTSLLRQVKQQ